MGRTDEVQFLRECVVAWQGYGARVTFQPGWETRGNGDQANYEGCIIHHTAFVSSAAKPNPALSTLINGRPDLSGPLCNATAPWSDSPWLHVIAAFPANHAGASGGRSMGPLPVTSLFNPRVLGLEIDYAGVTPMSPGQYRAALIFARGVCDVLGRSTEYARAHAETSITGKWDPGYALGKTLDMAVFRRDAAALTGDDMTPEEHNWLSQLVTVVGHAFEGDGRDLGTKIKDVHGWLAPVERYADDGQTKVQIPIRQEIADVKTALLMNLPTLITAAKDDGASSADLATQVAAAIPHELAQQVVDALGARLTGK